MVFTEDTSSALGRSLFVNFLDTVAFCIHILKLSPRYRLDFLYLACFDGFIVVAVYLRVVD